MDNTKKLSDEEWKKRLTPEQYQVMREKGTEPAFSGELYDNHEKGMHRTGVVCKNCASHLGYLFNDGPKETTGQRYCINSCVLTFQKK